MDYEKDILIDEANLDLDWLEQPALMMKYSRIAAQAKYDEDITAEKLKVLEAELDKQIRDDFVDQGVKVTEKVVQTAIITHEDYQDAVKKLTTARYETTMARAAVQAFEHKKAALENLVKLNGQQYFAAPLVVKELTEKKQQRETRRLEANKSVKIKRHKSHGKEEKE